MLRQKAAEALLRAPSRVVPGAFGGDGRSENGWSDDTMHFVDMMNEDNDSLPLVV